MPAFFCRTPQFLVWDPYGYTATSTGFMSGATGLLPPAGPRPANSQGIKPTNQSSHLSGNLAGKIIMGITQAFCLIILHFIGFIISIIAQQLQMT